MDIGTIAFDILVIGVVIYILGELFYSLYEKYKRGGSK